MSEKILVLDDDDQLSAAFREYLTELGYEVDCVQELKEAETLLAFIPYDLVITDLRLTKLGFGGLELVKHIRTQGLPTRIIVMTGYFWPELKAEASAHQVDAFLRKPTRLTDLSATIGSVLGEAS